MNILYRIICCRRRREFALPALATIAALLTGGPASADDIELFVATNNQALQCEAPNVLFVIDTSGSMDTLVTTQDDWNPANTYEGCFLPGSIYYSATGNPPDCGSEARFRKTANACEAFSNTEYSGEFQAWNPSDERWVRLADAQPEWSVECAADEGIHGDGAGGETYAVDGATGPWSADGTNRIAWGANASTVTVFDGNWLNWLQNPPSVNKSRLQIVQEVTKAALDNIDNVNVGLMELNGADGGSMRYAVQPIETAREPLKQVIDDLRAAGQTPLSEAMYEIGQYARGGTIMFGTPPAGDSVAASRVGNTATSSTYLSPMDSAGQNNYVILLTDGEPSNDIGANRLIEALPNYGTLVGDPCDDAIDGSCLDSMAEYLFRADLRPDIEGQQNIITHTIGFAVDLAVLASTAERGGGKYFIADNTASLTSVLTNLSKDFSRTASLLTAPRIPINSFNQADRLDDVYVSVFQPKATQHWPGNVKRYRLQTTDTGTIIVDANGRNVIDPATGFFRDNAVSFWSNPLVDGAVAELGGAASQLPPAATRTLLSNIGGSLQAVAVENGNITAAMIGAPDAERDITIEWARGLDSRDADEDGITLEQRLSIGDPLHVQPVTVSYGSDPDNSNAVVFVATNDGYLHAINATDGVEIWSFIPRRLLGRLYELSLEEPSVNKEYGLDGTLRVIEVQNRKILVFGMRRGGEAMFAMDVTNRNSPALRWLIDSGDSDFLDLGQTWSPATAARVSIGGTTKDVIVFAGGYDAGQDNGAYRTDTKGNAIYMVNTMTGTLEWSAGSNAARSDHDLELPRMTFSIPAAPRLLDTDRDTLTDRIYFGDMGGQVWRIDFVNGRGRTTLGEGGVIASVGAADAGAPVRADARRFYNTPDVVNVISDGKLFTAINIGSGYRAHPLDTLTDEEFFSIRDFRSQEVIPSQDYGSPALPIVMRGDLPDITDNLTPQLEPTDAGWRLRLEGPGEKVLSSALTVSNVLFFSSFTPTAAATTCLPGGGRNRLYAISVFDGRALTNLDQSLDPDLLTKEDRSVAVGRTQDVPLEVTFTPEGPCVGVDCYDDENELATGDSDGDGVDDSVDDLNLAEGIEPTETYWFPVTRP